MTTAPQVIIGLSGFAGVGKDEVRRILCAEHGYTGVAFADKVREMAAALDAYLPEVGTTYSQLVAQHTYDGAKRKFSCVRDYLIRIGHRTREVLGDSIWIDAVLPPDRKQPAVFPALAISDVRYPNEALRIKGYGGVVIRIHRPGIDAISETERASLAMTD